jgi:WD40 repeat protein
VAGGLTRSRLVGGNPREISFWGLDGKRQASFEIQVDRASTGWRELAVSPDGQFLAGALHRDAAVLEVDRLAEYGKQLQPRKLPHTDFINLLCFSPNGRFLACGAGRSAWLWDLSGEQPGVRFPAFRRDVACLAFHPNGHLFAAGSLDGEVHVSDTAGAREVLRLDLNIFEVRGLAFAPDGMTALAAGRANRVAVWDVD